MAYRRIGSNSAAKRGRNAGPARENARNGDRAFPPHPCPLPQGEGARFGRASFGLWLPEIAQSAECNSAIRQSATLRSADDLEAARWGPERPARKRALPREFRLVARVTEVRRGSRTTMRTRTRGLFGKKGDFVCLARVDRKSRLE